MTADVSDWRSGKGARDENFPVASRLLHRAHQPVILAFYDFVRSADDIADHPRIAATEKLRLLDRLEAGLVGDHQGAAEATTLRAALWARDLAPRHAQDLLRAFRQDVAKQRYQSWNELIDYCRYSAMPVGRFVLDVHGEAASTWPASDALCAALQIINHLQDVADDYRKLDRVYLPAEALTAAGARVEDLGEPRASPALRACLRGLAIRTGGLLEDSAPLPAQVKDLRLSLEIAAIRSLAGGLIRRLIARDPLSERVHLRRAESAAWAARGIVVAAWRRLRGAGRVAQAAGVRCEP